MASSPSTWEIARYELLERVARLAGDYQTADVGRRNRADEKAMAKKIAASWDKAAIDSLREEGVELTDDTATRLTEDVPPNLS